MKSSKKIFAVLSALLLVFVCVFPASAQVDGSGGVKTLIPGGMAFGVKFFTEGALVLGTTGIETAGGIVSPAKNAGLMPGDVIIRAGGKEFESAAELIELISGCGGKDIAIVYMRGEKEQKTQLTPARELETGVYRIGALVRDSTAGIGTVTYIDPETLDFGGLGHGIYDSETSVLMPMSHGAVVNVDIDSVVKSERNSPGELHGVFGIKAEGELWANTEQGVFGRFYSAPSTAGKAIPVASRSELTEGKAKILTTVRDSEVAEYDIEIESVYSSSGSTKNFLIRVTDKRLIDAAGGIVQGMSGSPVIQNGKLVGAVTHVLINDPLHGYGICIENMLKSAYDVSSFGADLKAA